MDHGYTDSRALVDDALLKLRDVFGGRVTVCVGCNIRMMGFGGISGELPEILYGKHAQGYTVSGALVEIDPRTCVSHTFEGSLPARCTVLLVVI